MRVHASFCFATCMLAVLALSRLAHAGDVAATPPMGWNSWNWFADKVTDRDIRVAADLLVASGMRDAGYVYVNIDDGWQGERDAAGAIHPNAKFPDMKALADYLHSKGLKLGIYSSPGPRTCAGYVGSYGHERQDAASYAEWGVDYLKYDLCSLRDQMDRAGITDAEARNRLVRNAYLKMHEAIAAGGRAIVYSLCQYGFDSVWEWGAAAGGNLWRTTGDISADYDRIVLIALTQIGLGKYAGPGHWNDPDMLEVGNGKLTHDENLTHMSFWAMLAAPLLAGNNLTRMTDDVLAILTNREVIAIDQDSLGRPARVLYQEGPVQIWSRPLADGSVAFAIFNIGTDRASMGGVRLPLREAGFTKGASARDVWAHHDLGVIQDVAPITVPSHGVMLLKLTAP